MRAGCKLLMGCHVEEGTRLFWLHPGDSIGVTGWQGQIGTFQLVKNKVSDRQVFSSRLAVPPPQCSGRGGGWLHSGLVETLWGLGDQ